MILRRVNCFTRIHWHRKTTWPVGKWKAPYYKTQGNQETDFLINPLKPILFQVCFEIQNPRTREREISSLLASIKELKIERGTILTKNDEETISIGNVVIRILPVWKWLLNV